jgi:hypothetical protein
MSSVTQLYRMEPPAQSLRGFPRFGCYLHLISPLPLNLETIVQQIGNIHRFGAFMHTILGRIVEIM